MKQFLTFIQKEFYHIFRDPRTILILLAMPIMQMLIFGFAISTEVKDARMAVYDPQPSPISRKISEQIEASPYFRITTYLNNPNETQSEFGKGNIDIALIFAPDVEQRIARGETSIQIITDGTDPNIGNTITNYASAIIQGALKENNNTQQNLSLQARLLYNPGMKSAYNFVPGVMGLILLLICTMMTSISIVREKEKGTMEVLLVSPMRPLFSIIAKLIPYMFLSIINLASILLISYYVLDVPITGSLIILCALSFVYILVALALGLLISIFAQSQVVAMLISGMVMMMPTMLLSGMIFPIENMPDVLQWISSIVPARWYISAVKKIMIQGVDIVFIMQESIILVGMAVLLLTISIKKFKIRL